MRLRPAKLGRGDRKNKETGEPLLVQRRLETSADRETERTQKEKRETGEQKRERRDRRERRARQERAQRTERKKKENGVMTDMREEYEWMKII
ncbi:hypothetical protein L484_020965 [Morus notabilis]|uniref:Uncharacterized protein n=1 Tax=Morus notabilis TaxID=981085 RepID=W9QIK3_9ROSA|nr:hypothetical protein L484_020965 [Morus notabilis]